MVDFIANLFLSTIKLAGLVNFDNRRVTINQKNLVDKFKKLSLYLSITN